MTRCHVIIVDNNKDRGALHKKYRTAKRPHGRAKKVWVPKRSPWNAVAGRSDNIRFAVAEMRRAIEKDHNCDFVGIAFMLSFFV